MAAPLPLPTAPIEILLVEDYAPDVLLARLALDGCRWPSHLQVAWDGLDALDVLHRHGAHEQAARPDLILLDLHLPRMDGVQLLAALQGEPGAARLPVVVLTTSPADLSLLGGLSSCPVLYLEKPLNEQRLTQVFQQLYGLEPA